MEVPGKGSEEDQKADVGSVRENLREAVVKVQDAKDWTEWRQITCVAYSEGSIAEPQREQAHDTHRIPVQVSSSRDVIFSVINGRRNLQIDLIETV